MKCIEWATNMKDGFAETPHFGRIHYKRGGRGDPLILSHSNGTSVYEYEPVWAALSNRFDLIVWDLPGQGDSDPFARHLTMDDYADAAMQLMEALEVPSAHIGGSSIGVPITLSFALRHTERAKSLIFIDGVFQNGDAWVGNWNGLEKIFTDIAQSYEDVSQRFCRTVSGSLFDRWNIDRVKAGRNMMDALWAYREYDMIDRVQGYTNSGELPDTLVLLGEKGPCLHTLPAFQQAFPHARIRILENCGHFPMYDDPETLVSEIIQFIDSVN